MAKILVVDDELSIRMGIREFAEYQGYKVEEIPVVMRARQGGVSSITMKKSVYYMIKVSLAILMEALRGKR